MNERTEAILEHMLEDDVLPCYKYAKSGYFEDLSLIPLLKAYCSSLRGAIGDAAIHKALL